MPADFHCHGCGGTFPHRPGADLYCTPTCEARYAERKEAAEIKLAASGFERQAESPHTWVKNGIAVSIERVLKTSHEEVIALYTQTLRANRAA